MNNDHAPRIRAQQQQAADQEAIEELERRSAPLLWAVFAAAFAVSMSFAVDGLSAHVERYTDMAATSEAFAQCLNGRMIKLGGAFVQCEVREIQLVSMGEQP